MSYGDETMKTKMETPKPLWPNPLPMTTEVRMYNDRLWPQVACERSDIYLDHDKSCDFCPYYPICTISIRRHSTEPKKKRQYNKEENTEKEVKTEPVSTTPTTTTPEDAPVIRRRGRPKGSENKQ